MSRILFGLSLVHFRLYDSKQRDPCEIAQTHMLSWAFSDHICRKYQQAIYEIPWYQFIGGTAQVDFMFGFDCKQNKKLARQRISIL